MSATPQTRNRTARAAVMAAALTVAATPQLRGDEGMWTFDNLPIKLLRDRYGFTPKQEWIDHLRLASVRFNDGGSGAFVSKNGLVLTNHHVALGQLQKMSTPKKDYVKEGFFAKGLKGEIACPDLEVNVLVSMEDVTARVRGAVDPKASDKDQNEQRKGEISRITKASTDETGLRSDVVELYQGGEYWLYRYKKYTDMRLVMAPELQAAFYGGDSDNFTYPRFALDFAFFRVYENGKPVKIEHYLKWSKDGAADGELVFVTGHPGRTDRLDTVAQLEYARDLGLPLYLKAAAEKRADYYAYAKLGAEQQRRSKDRIFGIENAIKAVTGEYEGLLDPKLLGSLRAAEDGLRKSVAESKDESTAGAKGSWDKIAAATKKAGDRRIQTTYRRFDATKVAGLANTVVRYVAEVAKPNDKRYEEFRDSALESLKFRLFSPAPMYPDMEEFFLRRALEDAVRELGENDDFVRAAIGGGEPAKVAKDLIAGTRLFDVAARRKLIEGGEKAVADSDDALIVWARKLDPVYRAQRKWYEDEIESVTVAEGNRIAKARFAVYGKSTYPDATFTLRMSYGKVAGYEQGTTLVAPFTTFYGLYDRAIGHSEKPPFDLAPRVKAAKAKLKLGTKVNFVTTNDIIGGNSGSPIVNAKGEYVGLVFDGNIHSLVGRYAYDDARNRTVAVHSSGILEALRAVYGMGALADEVAGRK
ncbi:MAG: S46 family peptidase [Elusimicrobia bacterium]|nr:S46 family peptidase [Elusimicrobiota bacterium]